MTDYKHLVERLRIFGGEPDTGNTYHEAAEAIESLAAELAKYRDAPELSALIERVEKMTIERCVMKLASKHSYECSAAAHHAGRWHPAYDYHMSRQSVVSECLEAIRSLPTGQIDIHEVLK